MTAPGPWELLVDAGTVLAVHAHPDDETLASGALLTHLAGRGTRVVLLTASRGEEGEVVAGAIAAGDERPLDEIRGEEVRRACEALGVAERHLLGTAPALAAGQPPRRYRDSGMRWVREGLAGPAETSGEDAFTRRPRAQALADLRALIEVVRPDVLLGYDDEGTYGHPDHVQAHHLAREASGATGIPRIEIASSTEGEGFAWRDLPGTGDAVRKALECYRTQLTVVGQDADGTVRIRHVGGQDDAVPLRAGLRG